MFYFIYFYVSLIKEVIVTGLIASPYFNHDMQKQIQKNGLPIPWIHKVFQNQLQNL